MERKYFDLKRIMLKEHVSDLVGTAYRALFSECPIDRGLAIESLKNSSDDAFSIKAVHSSDGHILFDMHNSQIGRFTAYGGDTPLLQDNLGYRSLWL